MIRTEGRGCTAIAMTRTLMDYTLLALILRQEMESIGKHGMGTIIH